MTSPLPPVPTVPIVRSSFASAAADEAWQILSQMYTRARPRAGSAEASMRFDGAATSAIAVDRGQLSTASGSFDESPDQLNIITVTRGRIGLDFGRRGTISNDAGDSYLYLPDEAAELRWDDFGALTVRMSPQQVADTTAELTGIEPRQLRFTSPRPLSPSLAGFWRRTVELLWQQLAAPGQTTLNALVHQELVTMTIAAAASVFPNTAMSRGYVAGPGDVRPAALRRAVAYVDTHAFLPITVTDVAAAAGTSPHAVRAAFRRHLDTTPTAYLRRVRLESAHRDLQSAHPIANTGADRRDGSVVREIATRWGFVDAPRFASAYRDAFGVLPEVTLRRGT